MSRKDFQKIADTIKGFNAATVDRGTIAREFARALSGEAEGRFDRLRFLRACGVDDA